VYVPSVQEAFGVARQNFNNAKEEFSVIVVRSAFFRGVLTGGAVPPQLASFERAARAAFERARDRAGSMAELALRFCPSIPGISSVLIGGEFANSCTAPHQLVT